MFIEQPLALPGPDNNLEISHNAHHILYGTLILLKKTFPKMASNYKVDDPCWGQAINFKGFNFVLFSIFSGFYYYFALGLSWTVIRHKAEHA